MVTEHRSAVLNKYGGEEHLNAPPKELLLVPNEQYVEYTESGLLKQNSNSSNLNKEKTRYPEDM